MEQPLPIAINGLGRIGRALLRIAIARPELVPVAVNDLDEAPSLARLVEYDSVHGRYGGAVSSSANALDVDGNTIACFSHAEPRDIPWQTTPARVVVEATGIATSRNTAAQHLRSAGSEDTTSVARVLVSAISDDADLMICQGINEQEFDADRHQVVSNASCTTHCLALLLTVLDRDFGVQRALMNEVHSYTATQNLVDGAHRDPRRARAAAINIVPTESAAPAAVERMIPHLKGRLVGCAVRVPTPNVALLDLVATLSRTPSDTEDVARSFRKAASGRLAGLLSVSEAPLVSSDFIGDPHSAIVDLPLIQTLDRRVVRIMAWYDNEWGYANRLADLLTFISRSSQ